MKILFVIADDKSYAVKTVIYPKGKKSANIPKRLGRVGEYRAEGSLGKKASLVIITYEKRVLFPSFEPVLHRDCRGGITEDKGLIQHYTSEAITQYNRALASGLSVFQFNLIKDEGLSYYV